MEGSDLLVVLSLFPGIGLLDMAFEEEGFCVVRGPDVIWGGDIRRFHPPAGRFDGVIGGPPCQSFSTFSNLQRAQGHEPSFGNLIPEFERCVSEAAPAWFVMENVPPAPLPSVPGYGLSNRVWQNRLAGGDQNRARRFSFGLRGAEDVPVLRQEYVEVTRTSWAQAVTSAHGGNRKTHSKKATGGRIVRYSLPDACELQGLPRDALDHVPFTRQRALKAVANGVPLPMGRAVARAVKLALGLGDRSPTLRHPDPEKSKGPAT